MNTYPLRDEEKKLIGFQEAIVDLTELTQYQKKLLKCEEKFRGIAREAST